MIENHSPVRVPDRNTTEIWQSVLMRASEMIPIFDELSLRVSATEAAKVLGLGRAERLTQWLRQRRLPPFRPFRNWFYVVRMVEIHQTGVSISRWALSRGLYSAMYYRLVRETSGLEWRVARELSAREIKALALHDWRKHLVDPRRELTEYDT